MGEAEGKTIFQDSLKPNECRLSVNNTSVHPGTMLHLLSMAGATNIYYLFIVFTTGIY